MKFVDQVYHCEIPGQVFGNWQIQCRLRIYYPHPEQQTVIVSDVGLETGWFIPYRTEALIERVVQDFQLNPELVVWIEHYSQQFNQILQDEFILVTLSWFNGKIESSQRLSISHESACALAGTTLHSKTLNIQ